MDRPCQWCHAPDDTRRLGDVEGLAYTSVKMSTALLRTDSLTKRYGDFTALDGLSMSVAPGEVVEEGDTDVIFSDHPKSRKTFDYVNGIFG